MEDRFNITLEENVFLAKKSIVENIYSNARVEGINITFPETYSIVQGANVARLSIDEIQCVLNLRDAWNYVINNVTDEFNIDFICKVNSFVSRNESLNWGVLRNGRVRISGVEYKPDIPDEEQVKKDINEILKIDNITQRAIKYLLYGMRSQLFWDGNKRTNMICANKIMIENGKGIIRIADKYIEEFNQLLMQFYNTNDDKNITQFIYYNCIEGIKFDN